MKLVISLISFTRMKQLLEMTVPSDAEMPNAHIDVTLRLFHSTNLNSLACDSAVPSLIFERLIEFCSLCFLF